ncbi:MAG TPA: sulfite exporter TauE/SafE family protein [Alphaproteobacteria bacterium]|nr:sulfite exporter TauE/SafE family protein [Alphaproteobacteria bacterium]
MNPESLILITIALGAGAMVKGATGMGLPLVALPVLATYFGIAHGLAILALPLVVTNIWQVWRYRAHAGGATFLPGLLIAGVFGIGLGTWALTIVPERALGLGLALLVLIYIALRLVNPELRISATIGRRLSPAVGVAAGALQGATGISAPVGVTFIHAMRLDRDAHVFAVSAMFLLFAATHLPALALAGILTWDRLLEGVFALLPVLLMMPVGAWLARFLSRQAFDRAIMGLLCLITIKLIFDSL